MRARIAELRWCVAIVVAACGGGHAAKHDAAIDTAIDGGCDGAGNCACGSNADCQSHVCVIALDPTRHDGPGTCAVQSEVAYVASSGSGAAPCSFTDPCATVSEALATQLAIISVAGAIVDNVSVASHGTLSIVGFGSGAAIVSASPDTDVLAVSGSAADVTVRGLEVTGATGSGNGVVVDGAAATLAMVDCAIHGNAGLGVVTTSANGTVTVTRSTIASNTDGGMSLQAGLFVVTNDFVIDNGTVNGSVGGIVVGNAVAEASRLEYVTVAGNIVVGNDANIGTGVTCDNAAIAVTNSIVADNLANTSLTTGSDVAGCAVAGPTFIGDDPSNTLRFVDPPLDYHIGSGSIAVAAGTLDDIVVDVDDNVRPQQPAHTDLGADELFEGVEP